MVKRSLTASQKGIEQAKLAFARIGWTQENLAFEVNIKTRQPIWRFFSGQPIERHTFIEICSVLSLNWRSIASNPPGEFSLPVDPHINIDALVQRVRSQRFEKIQFRCGILQLLDIGHPVSIDDIYIDVNILSEIASLKWFDISDLQKLDTENFENFGKGLVSEKQMPGMQAIETYSKLRVLGKPGVGKTTFLQHLAIGCNQGVFLPNIVPIFITLRNLASESKTSRDYSIFNYIRTEFINSGISDPSVIETLLDAGSVLLLLDGMDEILKDQSNAVLKEIRLFSDKYHKNKFVVTCRVASQKLQLRGFTDVEIAHQYSGHCSRCWTPEIFTTTLGTVAEFSSKPRIFSTMVAATLFNLVATIEDYY